MTRLLLDAPPARSPGVPRDARASCGRLPRHGCRRGIGRRRNLVDGVVEHAPVRPLADQHALRLARAERRGTGATQDEPGAGDPTPAVERDERRDADEGEIAGAPRDLEKRAARPRRRAQNAAVGQELLRRRLPFRLGVSSASSATITAGSSEAGSACATLPPTVPR